MANIIRWNPIREMAAMQSMMDRIFDDVWANNRATVAGNLLAVDLQETDEAYRVITTLPGVNADDINISLHEGTLTISGEIAETTVAENTRVVVQERLTGKFSRSIRLPEAVDVDKVEASYDNGVLTLNLPKSPTVQPKMIPVKQTKVLQNKN